MDPLSVPFLISTSEERPQMTYKACSNIVESLSTEDPGFQIPELDGYIDFNSPILTHLIEIEKKYWTSETNRNYRIRKDANDSEASLESMEGITTYNLYNQKAQEPLVLVPNKSGKWMGNISYGSKQKVRDKSSDADSQDWKSQNSSGLQEKVKNRLKKMYIQTASKNAISKTTVVSQLDNVGKFLDKRPQSPGKLRLTAKERDLKSIGKETSKRHIVENDNLWNFSTVDKGKKSYLHFESSKLKLDQYKVDPKKLFLKKANSNLRCEKSSKERQNKSRDKISKPLTMIADHSNSRLKNDASTSRLYSKLLVKNSQNFNPSRCAQSKFDSGFLGRQKKVLLDTKSKESIMLKGATPSSPKDLKTVRQSSKLKSRDKQVLNIQSTLNNSGKKQTACRLILLQQGLYRKQEN